MAGHRIPGGRMSKDLAPQDAEVIEKQDVATVDEYGDVEPFVDENGEILLAGAAAHKLRELLAVIPVADDNGNAAIIESLMSAGSVLDLNRPWDATGAKEFAGKLLRIDTLKALPSRFQGGIRAFLVIDAWNCDDNAPATLTTSALAVVVQTARAYAEGWLPAWCRVEIADAPTERGFYPYHLRFVPPPAQVAS